MMQLNLTAQRPWRLAVLLLAVFGLISGIPGMAQSAEVL